MAKSMKIRAKIKNGTCEVKALLKHIMETGFRKDKATGKTIPAHFIQELTCSHNGNVVITANCGSSISKNPFISFKVDNVNKGDSIELAWVDNMGEKDNSTVKAG